MDGLHRTLALAGATAEVGRSGTALAPENHVLSRLDGDTWLVRIGEVAPGLAGNGIERRVDPVRSLVDGQPVEVPARAEDASLSALEEAGWACAISLSDGRGVGGSPLVRGSARLTERDLDQVLVAYDEEAPTTLPAGLEVMVGRGCARVPMD